MPVGDPNIADWQRDISSECHHVQNILNVAAHHRGLTENIYNKRRMATTKLAWYKKLLVIHKLTDGTTSLSLIKNI